MLCVGTDTQGALRGNLENYPGSDALRRNRYCYCFGLAAYALKREVL